MGRDAHRFEREARLAGPVTIPCNLCGSLDAEPVRNRDRHGASLRSVICRSCGLVWTDPRPTTDEVREFYMRDYRVEYKRTHQPKLKHTLRAGKAALERLARLRPVLEPGATLFDVGAGGGEVVYVARAMEYQASGIEPNRGYAKYAAEVLHVPVVQGVYQDAPVPPASLGVVTMFHTAEHLEDPDGAMRAARQWLVPGGILAIEVPNVEAICHQPHQQFHRGHLYHFNLPTLEQMGRCAGYAVHSSGTTTDGGNIWVTLMKVDLFDSPSAALPGNYHRVRTILDRHTGLRHGLSTYPYVRPLKKLATRVSEWRAVRSSSGPARLLDTLIGEHRNGDPRSAGTPAHVSSTGGAINGQAIGSDIERH